MAPASTNSLRQRSSIPLVVRMTLAPEARILRIRSRVMSDSLCWVDNDEMGKVGKIRVRTVYEYPPTDQGHQPRSAPRAASWLFGGSYPNMQSWHSQFSSS